MPCAGDHWSRGIFSTDLLGRTLLDHEADAVIHFAASAYVGESVENPAKYYRNNVAGSLSVFEACRRASVSRLVFSSSCATYGIPEKLPINESTPQRPINPYGRSKAMGERMLEDHAEAYGLRYVSLRYFNASGADPDGELFERHDPETHIIPCALMSASGRAPYLSVFGNDYDTADGTCVRDYIHVTDLARAHVLAVGYLQRGGEDLAVNVGSGQATSIRDIIRTVQRITDRHVPIVIKPRRSGDPPALIADANLARERLGFSPQLSDIETIVRTAAPGFGLDVRP
jgi:UDP-arabinose 4-epimerase